jgi:hypothetical protein
MESVESLGDSVSDVEDHTDSECVTNTSSTLQTQSCNDSKSSAATSDGPCSASSSSSSWTHIKEPTAALNHSKRNIEDTSKEINPGTTQKTVPDRNTPEISSEDSNCTSDSEDISEYGSESDSGLSDSELSTPPESPSDADSAAVFAWVIDLTERQLLDRLMREAPSIIDQEHELRTRPAGNSPKNTGSTSQLSSHSAAGQWQGSSSQKRVRKREGSQGAGEGDDDDDDDDEPGEPTKRYRPNKPHSKIRGPLLACPFYQKNPTAYRQFRSCTGPGWPTCHRLK